MRVALAWLLSIALSISVTGCGDTKDTSPKPIAQKTDIPDLVKRLKEQKSTLGLRAVVNQIGSLGTEANTPEVIKALEDARKRFVGSERKLIDDTIAKVKGSAPVTGDAKK